MAARTFTDPFGARCVHPETDRPREIRDERAKDTAGARSRQRMLGVISEVS